MKINKILGILVFVSILGNIILSYYIASASPSRNITTDESADHTQFPYLSMRIFVQSQNDIIINFVDLRSKLRNYIEGLPDKVGMYFEYLPSGVSIGINEKDEYVLASLLKVPLAISVYKAIEDGKLSPNHKYVMEERHMNREFGTLWKKGIGASFNYEELVKVMLTESDNTASNMLFESVPPDSVENVFESLDIPQSISENAPVVTAKNYSSILRSLYLSSILETKHSNKILEFLTQSVFNDQIVAGAGRGVKTAHKIGVYPGKNKNDWIYTDCGIVYVPKRPYVLCLMTKNSKEKANNYMKTISSYVYDYVSTANYTSK